MVILYFGQDSSYEKIEREIGYNRRNNIILKELSLQEQVSKVYAFNYVTRKTFLRNIFKPFSSNGVPVCDVNFTDLVNSRNHIFRNLNRLFTKLYLSIVFLRYRRRERLSWIYWPDGYALFQSTGLNSSFVFDADHNILDDPNVPEDEKPQRVELLNEIALRASMVISASNSMLQWFSARSAPVLRVRNGIDNDRFMNLKREKYPDFTVVYCGVFSKWVEYDLFKALVRRNRNYTFLIIGKQHDCNTLESLLDEPNVKYLGEKKAAEVPAILVKCHAALTLYRTDAGIDGDSMKIYEYLAAGLPVVSTNYHRDLAVDFEGLLFLADTVEDFNEILLSVYVGVAPDEKKISQFLERSSWNSRVKYTLRQIL